MADGWHGRMVLGQRNSMREGNTEVAEGVARPGLTCVPGAAELRLLWRGSQERLPRKSLRSQKVG